MQLPIYQVDAFASELFEGNPAAVCPLSEWISDKLMQHIAMENNLSETAFFVPQNDRYRLRWFTPATEVDLCGHATLAAAHVLFEHLDYQRNTIKFETNSGVLKVSKRDDRLVMDFPVAELNDTGTPDVLENAIGHPPKECYRDMDYLYVLEDEQQVQSLNPDINELAKVDTRGIIVTAPSTEYDFVSRFFAPAAGVDEDPVTGSAHTMLTPYWSQRLGKEKLMGRQVSQRGGTVYCHHKNGRVMLGGQARTFMQGVVTL